MIKKVTLPLFSDPVSVAKPAKEVRRRPSVDAARARLGGRIGALDAPPVGFAPGVIVTFARREAAGGGTRAGVARVPGVVVFASQTEVHVLLDGVHLRRVPPSALALHDGGVVTAEIEAIAGDARLFGQIVEGQAVRYADEAGALVQGVVIEKCRWGALVRRLDGVVVAVGFRKLWPAASGGAA